MCISHGCRHSAMVSRCCWIWCATSSAYLPLAAMSSLCVPFSATEPFSTSAIWLALTTVDRRWAIRMTVCSPVQMRASRDACTSASLDASRDEVASSRRRRRGSRRSARQMARRCFCPPESRVPRSPTRVRYPSGRPTMNSCACARCAACTSCSCV
mmetsp:Transcript_29898/g.80354  ORF Transcript_29898/g.80354 Transcript_29898/m.80354 type:complete len:156 (-) Transcript_29898:2292-2759(-)